VTRRLYAFVIALALLFAICAVFRFCEAGTTGFSGQQTLPAGILVQPGALTNGQALRIGESVVPTFDPRVSGLLRPVGAVIYGRTGTIAYVRTPSFGAQGSVANVNTSWEKMGSGAIASGSNRAGLAAARAQWLTSQSVAGGIDQATWTCHTEEFDRIAPWGFVSTLTGTGTVTAETSNFLIGGWALLQTGATAASRAELLQNLGVVPSMATQRQWYFAARLQVTGTIDAATSLNVGLYPMGAPLSSLFIGICGATSTTAWTFQRDADATAACAGTVTQTGVSYSSGVTHNWEMWADGTLNVVHVAADYQEVTGSPFTLASPSSTSTRLAVEAENGATAANRLLRVDWITMCWGDS
jgi:hypothetical protein